MKYNIYYLSKKRINLSLFLYVLYIVRFEYKKESITRNFKALINCYDQLPVTTDSELYSIYNIYIVL